MTTGQIEQIGSLTETKFHDDVTRLDELRHGIGLIIHILVGETAVGSNSEMHKAILRMVVAICPVVDFEIGPYLFQGILFALDELVEVEKLLHSINLGMELIKTVIRIHTTMV